MYKLTYVVLVLSIIVIILVHVAPFRPSPSSDSSNLSTTSVVVSSAWGTSSPKKEAAWAAELREIGKQRHLKWSVFCNDQEHNPQEYYIAFAHHADDPATAFYKEDGALPQWVVYGPTQQAAGQALLLALNSPENWYPPSKPEEVKPAHQCKSRISGGWGKADDYAYEDCKDCGVK